MPEVQPNQVARSVAAPRAPAALLVPARFGTELTEIARLQAPAESCGLVFGSRREDSVEVGRIVALRNRAGDPRRRFAQDPVEVAQAIGAAERAGLAFLGVFHSHPLGDAELSTTDRAEGWPHCLHFVVGLATGEVRAHWLAAEGRSVELPFAGSIAP